ncbi:MAG: hypothetical protein AAFU60_01770, partial [Bacteroidota bacterium]
KNMGSRETLLFPTLIDNREVIPSSYAYIPNRTDNTLSVINVGTEAPLGEAVVTIPVGDSPRTVAVSPDNRRVYVGNSEGESLSVIQTYSNTVTQTLPLGSRPAAIAVSPNHRRIAVTTADHPSGNNPKLRIFDANSYTELGSYTVEKDPDALVFGPEGTLYVASHDNSNNGVIDVIDAAGVQQADIPLGANFRPEAMTLLSEGSTSKLFVAGANNPGKLIEISLADPSTLSTTVVGQSPEYMTISPDGTKLYILESNGSLHFYDTSSNTLTAYGSSTCTNPGGMSLSKDGTHLFISCTDGDIVKNIDLTTQTTGTDIMVGDAPVSKGNFVAGIIPEEYVTALHPTAYITNSGSDNVSVINSENYEVVATIPVGDYPEGITISPDKKRAYVTNNEGNSVSVINTTTNQVIKTIDVGEEPMGICVHPNGSEVYVANLGVPGGTAPNYTATYGSISVIDANSLTVSRTISNVYNPYGICIDGTGTNLYVSNYYSGTVSVYDAATGTPHAHHPTITVGTEPSGLVLVKDDAALFVANHGSSSLSVISFDPDPTVAPIVTSRPMNYGKPVDLALRPDGEHVLAYNEAYQQIVSFYVHGNASSSFTIPDGPPGTRGIDFSPDNNKMFTVESALDEVKVYKDAGPSLLATIPVGDNPESFGDFITKEEIRAYIPIEGSNIHTAGAEVLAVVDTELDVVEAYVHNSATTPEVELSPDGNYVLVHSSDSEVVEVVSTLTNTVESSFSVGANVIDMKYSPDGTKIYTTVTSSNTATHNILVVDPNTWSTTPLVHPSTTHIGHFQVNPNGGSLFGKQTIAPFGLIVIDLNSNNETSLDFSPAQMEKIIFSDQYTSYVSTSGGAIKILQYYNGNLSITKDIPNLGDIKAMAISPFVTNTKWELYYINGSNNRVSSVNIRSTTVPIATEQIARVGANSSCMQLSPDGKRLYVLDPGTTNLIAVDLAAKTAENIQLNGQAMGCGCFVRYPK